EDVTGVGPCQRQGPASHAPDADRVREERQAEERTDDRVGHSRESLAEEHESRLRASDLEWLQQVRHPEESEEHRGDREERTPFPHGKIATATDPLKARTFGSASRALSIFDAANARGGDRGCGTAWRAALLPGPRRRRRLLRARARQPRPAPADRHALPHGSRHVA